MSQKRLQAYLAEAGVASRRASEKLILEGLVKVNGHVVKELGTKVEPGVDIVSYRNKKIYISQKVLYTFYKQKNLVTTMQDPEGRPCLGDYVVELPERIFPVGRLDRDVTGLLLLTNDGTYADKLLHPRNQVPRTYLAVVKGVPSSKVLEKLCKKVRLDGVNVKADSAILRKPDNKTKKIFGLVTEDQSIIELTVSEGRNHFIKNLLKAVGFPVKKLCRTSFGPYSLGAMQVGEIRKTDFKKLD